MTVQEVLEELEQRGSEQTKKTFLRHGAKEPFYGVKVGDLKVLQKRIKVDHDLALGLYDTGNSDAMYLAGLIADPPQMTKAQLRKWAKGAYWYMISSFTLAWVASESKFAVEMAKEWMDSPKEQIANAGWATYASYVMITPDADLDLPEIESLLSRIQKEISTAPNRVKYTMNSFLIAVGCSVKPLTAQAKAVAKAIGKVEVDMGDTDCKVPDAAAYIDKIKTAGKLGAKRKSARC